MGTRAAGRDGMVWGWGGETRVRTFELRHATGIRTRTHLSALARGLRWASGSSTRDDRLRRFDGPSTDPTSLRFIVNGRPTTRGAGHGAGTPCRRTSAAYDSGGRTLSPSRVAVTTTHSSRPSPRTATLAFSSTVELYPAVDVQGGRVVRLRQGAADDATAYADDPVAVAQGFARDGASWVHFVDLDRAFGRGDNRVLARGFLAAVRVPVQVGGGLRSAEAIEEMLDWGAARVVIGTKAATDPALVDQLLARHGPERLAVGIERGRPVAVRGWTEVFTGRPPAGTRHAQGART